MRRELDESSTRARLWVTHSFSRGKLGAETPVRSECGQLVLSDPAPSCFSSPRVHVDGKSPLGETGVAPKTGKPSDSVSQSTTCYQPGNLWAVIEPTRIQRQFIDAPPSCFIVEKTLCSPEIVSGSRGIISRKLPLLSLSTVRTVRVDK